MAPGEILHCAGDRRTAHVTTTPEATYLRRRRIDPSIRAAAASGGKPAVTLSSLDATPARQASPAHPASHERFLSRLLALTQRHGASATALAATSDDRCQTPTRSSDSSRPSAQCEHCPGHFAPVAGRSQSFKSV